MTTIVFRGAEPCFELSGRRSHILSRLMRAWAWVQRRRRIAIDRRHLQAMPDELLRDIGLGRSEIESATEFGRAVLPRR